MFYIFAFFWGGGGAESWPVWGGLAGGPRAGSGRVVSGGGAESKIWRKGLRGGGPRAGSGGSLSGGGPKTSMF